MEQNEQKEENKIQFSEIEIKEKIILDYNFLLNEIETKVEDKKLQKLLKKSCVELGNNLQYVLNVEVSKKNIKNYIQLKNSNFDNNFLRLAKYIK